MNFCKISPILPFFSTKMLPKWQFLFYPFCYGRKWPKCFQKSFGEYFNIIFIKSTLCYNEKPKTVGKNEFFNFSEKQFFSQFFFVKKIKKTKLFGREK